MKTKLLILALLISVSAFGQIEIAEGYPLLEPHGNDSLCKTRGHVLGGLAMTTLLYCPDRVEDYEDYSVHIYGDCNTTTSECQRCGKLIETKGWMRSDTTWYKKKVEPVWGKDPSWITRGEVVMGGDIINQFIFGDSLAAHNLRITKLDTVPVIMLVCDTAKVWVSRLIKTDLGNGAFCTTGQSKSSLEHNTDINWQFGYSVRSASEYSTLGKTEYLDKNKKPLPKNIVVWMSKEIK
jgi:hypothetical protein